MSQQSEKEKKPWNYQEKHIKININRYIAKYDFDIAKRICPTRAVGVQREELQSTFKATALMEVLQQCSGFMSRGKKNFQTLYTLDGRYIRDLDEIPDDCQIVLVSENAPPREMLDRLIVRDDGNDGCSSIGGSQ